MDVQSVVEQPLLKPNCKKLVMKKLSYLDRIMRSMTLLKVEARAIGRLFGQDESVLFLGMGIKVQSCCCLRSY